MMGMFRQYFVIIGNAFIGVVFGFAFFYLFLNIYHYQDIRRGSYIAVNEDNSMIVLDKTLERIQANIDQFQKDNYQGTMDYSKALLLNLKLQNCVNAFQNDTIQDLRKKTYIDIKDVYAFQESYENDILNDCIVTYLYALSDDPDQSFDDPYIIENKELLRGYMDTLLHETSYLKKDLYDNSSYYFTTDNFSLTVKNNVKDGFYEVLSAYNNASKFLEIISEWYADGVKGGAV